MKALDWLLPAVALFGWAMFCHLVREFPLWITVIEVVVAILMTLASVAIHYVRSWSIPPDTRDPVDGV